MFSTKWMCPVLSCEYKMFEYKMFITGFNVSTRTTTTKCSSKCSLFDQYKMFECSVQNVHHWYNCVQNVHHWFNCEYKMFVQMSSSLSPEEEAPGDSYLTLSWQKQKFNLLQISLLSTHFVTVVNTANENRNVTHCGCGRRSKDAL